MKVHGNGQRATLIIVGAIIMAGGIAGVLLGRRDVTADVGPGSATSSPAVAAAPGAAARLPTSARESPAAVSPALGDSELAQLGAATMSGPRESRLAAIQRLSHAPRAQAIPLLNHVMLNGEPGVDRPAALLALRELALAQGDGDERIRDAVREVIYHGDDENLAAEAQDTLDVIGEIETK